MAKNEKKTNTSKKTPTTSKKTSTTPKKPSKKSSTLKWFIIVLILVGIESFYVYKSSKAPLVRTLADAINVNTPDKLEETFVPSTDTTKFKLYDKKSGKMHTQQATQNKDYYVLMQICLSTRCLRQEKRNIQAMQEHAYVTSSSYKTIYYEVVSTRRLSYKQSKSVVSILKQSLFTRIKPFIRQVAKERYVVSFGIFDNKDDAQQLYLILLRTYALTKVKFHVVRGKGNIKMYKVYAGALTRKTALRLITKSHLQGEFSAKKLYSSKELKISK